MDNRERLLHDARELVRRRCFEEARERLDKAPAPSRRRPDGSVRELRLQCCLELNLWTEAADLADALLHDRLKPDAVARFHHAFARHRLNVGDRSRALWEIAIALQTDNDVGEAIVDDEAFWGLLDR